MTESPNKGVPVNNAPLTEGQLQFITLADQYWLIHGVLFTKEQAEETYGLPSSWYDKFIADAGVLAALKERGLKGLPAAKAGALWKEHVLTPEQLLIANTMLDLVDTRSQKKKLADNNIATRTYNRWLKDPAFQNYLRERAESMLGENQHEAHLALLDKVRLGDIKAIQYYNEMTGRYTQAAARNGNGPNSVVDVQNLLIRILEIVQDEVDDPNTIIKISERLKALGNASTIAGELVAPQVVEPEIAQAQVLTPELKQLMESGEGFNE